MYDTLDTKKTIGLRIIKRGLFSREYKITDNFCDYGLIAFERFAQSRAIITTAKNTWIVRRERFFSLTTLITDNNGATLGIATTQLFTRLTRLKLQTGLQVNFFSPSLFSRQLTASADGYGKIMTIDRQIFSRNKTIHFEQTNIPESVIPLLTFFGAYLIILQSRRKARH
jgi:hypothetical protein